MDRDESRRKLAEGLKEVSSKELLQFGITRVASITGLDITGIPVFTSARPLGRTVSINSGKSIDPVMARAGAIIEGVEFAVAEHGQGEFAFAPWRQINPVLPLARFPKARGSVIHEDLPTSWEPVEALSTDLNAPQVWVPSNLVWLQSKQRELFMHFQASSNGLGSGFNVLDATLSAAYEVVERDSWTIFVYSQERHTKLWPKVDCSGFPLNDVAEANGLFPAVFDITTSVGVPVFAVYLFDPTNEHTGCFAGFGCHRDPFKAMERAFLEAFQSRVCYIAGARDDLMRRNFTLLKRTDQKASVEVVKGIPFSRTLASYTHPEPIGMVNELAWIVGRLRKSGFTEIYSKTLAEVKLAGQNISVVRVIVPGLEPPRFDGWTPSERCLKLCQNES